MGIRVLWLTLIRALLIVVSLGTIACHIAQVVLLGNHDWFPKNYSYILFFVGPGVSTLSSCALTMMCSVKSIRGDRLLGTLNLTLMIATVVIGTVKSGPVPWKSGDTYDSGGPKTGFQPSCSIYLPEDSTMYQRCWLSNGTWIGSIVIAACWVALILYVFIQRSSDIYDHDEYEVYDFKNTSQNGIAMAVTSKSPIPLPFEHQQQQQKVHDQPHIDTPYGHSYHEKTYTGYEHPFQQQQQPYNQVGYIDHHHHSNSTYGSYRPMEGYNNNNSGHGYYVPTPGTSGSPLITTNTQHGTTASAGGSHTDDTTHIMKDIGGVDRSPYYTPTPPESHQVPHAYD